MKKTRSHSVLTGNSNLESVYTIPNMPVHFGCVKSDCTEDIFLDQEFVICRETGIIQIKSFPTNDLLYMTRHNDAIGSVWKGLYDSIVQVVENNFKGKKISVLEIGGGSGKLALKIMERLEVEEYTMIEPNPDHNLKIDYPGFKLVRGYYEDIDISSKSYDLILHSHVLEHVDNPSGFMKYMSDISDDNTIQIFVIPNLKETFSRKYTNAINFEHTFFLTDEYVDIILNNVSMKVMSKELFLDHSIIYTARKDKDLKFTPLKNLYTEHLSLLKDFISHHKEMVERFNSRIRNFEGEVFLFGAHIFSQYLIGFGLDTSKVSGILDNSPIKIGKRLYGTSLEVFHPSIIKDRECLVVLKVASYRDEILSQINNISSIVKIVE